MRHIILGALDLVMRRINSCTKAIQKGEDVPYWHKELEKNLNLKSRIEKRFNMRHNVLYVDFQSKRRVA